jgi:glycosyltransferase involved in cell wall biosynthesis
MLVQNNRLRASDLRRLRDETSNFGHRPRVSILLPVFDPEREWLEWGLDSVLSQVYSTWELCICGDGSTEEHAREVLHRYERLDERIKVRYLEGNERISGSLDEALSVARGEFVGLLDSGDELTPDALFEVIKLLQEHPEADLIYSDEDEIDDRGDVSNPHFKPGWSPDLLFSGNYVSHLSVYRRSLLEEVGGFKEGFEGCQDYDLLLRITEQTDEIHHVPKVLYHRRAAAGLATLSWADKRRIRDKTRRALSEGLRRRGLEGSVEYGYLPDRFRVRLKIKDEPKVSIIIPTRDNVSFLRRCIGSVERLTTYRNYELLIIDNNSSDRATVKYLASTPHRVIPFKEAFNYSRINNFAVSQAEGEYVLLLNDDTEVISDGWLEALLEHAQRPEVGAVGAKLLYPDGRIQHAGVVVGVGTPWGPGVAMHSHQFYSSDSPGYAGTLMATANYSAVTAACMLLRKSLFKELGGLDEKNLPIQFNDVDLCLRMREQGYYIIYTPYAQLYHHESVSRKYWSGDLAENLYMRERWGDVMDKDPYYNANFSRGYGDFNLRADLLRPKVLREEAEQTQRVPVNWFENPWEYWRYKDAQFRAARSSPRTAIIPKPANRTVRASRQRQDQPPELAGHAVAQPGLRKPGVVAVARTIRRAAVRLFHIGTTELNLQGPVRAEQLIWMFGHSRTGSTWLSWIMAELENQERWHEPYVGLLFGSFIYERLKDDDKLLNNPAFIMGEPYRKVWLGSIRNFILEGATARYPDLKEDQYLIVKEPNGSIGAPLLLEATPESRLIFLIRDSRDVIASRLDAFREGSWARQNQDYNTAEKLNAATKHLAEDYLRVVSKVQEAYKVHSGKKAFVRYEDLRYDTINVLKTMYAALEIEADEAQLEAAVLKHSWTRIPNSEKGKDKFFRKAQPESWRDDLSLEQIRLIEDITGPILSKYYSY